MHYYHGMTRHDTKKGERTMKTKKNICPDCGGKIKKTSVKGFYVCENYVSIGLREEGETGCTYKHMTAKLAKKIWG
jgi:hypothetical protein